ncbi:hypothetical protein R1T16_16215 [Flavobacterium sp. DG1-102-2]|uniref:hypothetical protein n=1 Tax=Flavobacterium sp. DG1-102-2 TaxID=3081663 RepID=UPI00294A14AF|nr:hypothetical protein [Flavobacterium sp. DG1-102-2]MDV6169984.1 hypothetical protein [Flavobacterium sp. DG1-102-2]
MSGLLILTISTITLVSCSEEDTIETRDRFNTKIDPPKSGGILFGITIGRNSLGCDGIGFCRVKDAKVTVGGVSVNIPQLAPIKQVNVITPAPPGPTNGPFPIPRPGPSNRTYSTGVASYLRIEFFDDGLEDSRPNLTYAKMMFGGNNIILEEPFIFDTSIWDQKDIKNFTSDTGSFPITLNPETGRYGITLTGTLE